MANPSRPEPLVAVIGRPNVGKSTLVNRFTGERKAIVHDTPGLTRDRVYYPVEWCGRNFTVVDTGGLVPDSDDPFGPLINQQVDEALQEADVVVFVVDGPLGLTPSDEAVADHLRKTLKKPILVAANKLDRFQDEAMAADFYSLGFDGVFPVSAMHGTVGDLLDAVAERLPVYKAPESTENTIIRLALVGRPNVGKSSILNALIGERRAIVSDVAGTTRDSVDVSITVDGQTFVLVDTAGIRRKGKVDYGVELFSVDRAVRAIRQCDVAVLVMDASDPNMTDQDKRILETIVEAGRGMVLVLNKWDLVPDKGPNSVAQREKRLFMDAPQASFARLLTTSAQTHQRTHKLFALAKEAFENNQRRVKTSLVNHVLLEAVTMSPPPPIKNRRLKVLYATQVAAEPPAFVLFVNDAKLMKDSYKRYLEKKLREAFAFTGAHLVLMLRSRESEKK
jgi:GTP-binding protein